MSKRDTLLWSTMALQKTIRLVFMPVYLSCPELTFVFFPTFTFLLSYSTPLLLFVTPPTPLDPAASCYVHRSSCYESSWRSPVLGGTSLSCFCVSSSACHCTTSSRSTPPRAAGSTARWAAWYPWTICVTGRFGLMNRPCCRRCKASRLWESL